MLAINSVLLQRFKVDRVELKRCINIYETQSPEIAALKAEYEKLRVQNIIQMLEYYYRAMKTTNLLEFLRSPP